MARRPKRGAPAPAHPWMIDLEGQSISLVPALPALVGIEVTTDRTLYQHLIAASERAMPIKHLAMILRFLAGPECPLAALRPPIDGGNIGYVTAQIFADTAEAIVIRAGLIDVLAAIVPPLVAATKGHVDEMGRLKLAK